MGLTLLVIEATPAWPKASAAPSANELAKEISNPVTSLWQLQFQFNNDKLESGNFNPALKLANGLSNIVPASLFLPYQEDIIRFPR